MNAFDVLGDPVRRRILELLAASEAPAGQVVDIVGGEFGISQPAISQHLRVLRDHGFARVRPDGNRRLYSLETSGLDAVDEWASSLRRTWQGRLDSLETEVARGKRDRRRSA